MNPKLEYAEHFAARARKDFEPAAYTRLSATGAGQNFDRYLKAARTEASYVLLLLDELISASGQWPTGEAATLWRLANDLSGAINRAWSSIEGGEAVLAARDSTAVALLWLELRQRDEEVSALSRDVQRAATASGEDRAEKQLRSLAELGGRPYRDDWREEAISTFGLTGRAAQRVWEKVATDHPALSSTVGKAKRRKP